MEFEVSSPTTTTRRQSSRRPSSRSTGSVSGALNLSRHALHCSLRRLKFHDDRLKLPKPLTVWEALEIVEAVSGDAGFIVSNLESKFRLPATVLEKFRSIRHDIRKKWTPKLSKCCNGDDVDGGRILKRSIKDVRQSKVLKKKPVIAVESEDSELETNESEDSDGGDSDGSEVALLTSTYTSRVRDRSSSYSEDKKGEVVDIIRDVKPILTPTRGRCKRRVISKRGGNSKSVEDEDWIPCSKSPKKSKSRYRKQRVPEWKIEVEDIDSGSCSSEVEFIPVIPDCSASEASTEAVFSPSRIFDCLSPHSDISEKSKFSIVKVTENRVNADSICHGSLNGESSKSGERDVVKVDNFVKAVKATNHATDSRSNNFNTLSDEGDVVQVIEYLLKAVESINHESANNETNNLSEEEELLSMFLPLNLSFNNDELSNDEADKILFLGDSFLEEVESFVMSELPKSNFGVFGTI